MITVIKTDERTITVQENEGEVMPLAAAYKAYGDGNGLVTLEPITRGLRGFKAGYASFDIDGIIPETELECVQLLNEFCGGFFGGGGSYSGFVVEPNPLTLDTMGHGEFNIATLLAWMIESKPVFVNVNPMSATGSERVRIDAVSGVGREGRTGNVVFKPAAGRNVTRAVIQEGKGEVVKIDPQYRVRAEGGNIEIRGTSTSSSLTFSYGSGNITINIPATYTANSVTTNNGYPIAGDPGAEMEFEFRLNLSIPVNSTGMQLMATIIVTAEGGQTSECEITQER